LIVDIVICDLFGYKHDAILGNNTRAQLNKEPRSDLIFNK